MKGHSRSTILTSKGPRPKSHGEYWVTDEVIVALGCDVSRKRALKVLRHVVQRIEFEMAKARRYK